MLVCVEGKKWGERNERVGSTAETLGRETRDRMSGRTNEVLQNKYVWGKRNGKRLKWQQWRANATILPSDFNHQHVQIWSSLSRMNSSLSNLNPFSLKCSHDTLSLEHFNILRPANFYLKWYHLLTTTQERMENFNASMQQKDVKLKVYIKDTEISQKFCVSCVRD